MPAGSPRSVVPGRFRALRRQDATYQSGRIVGSMGTAPHPVAAAVHHLFQDANLGDPGHVPGAAQLEREYGKILHNLAGGDPGGAFQVTSGASEANILALAWMRLKTGGTEIIVPRTGHFSLEKAAKFLGLKLRIAETDPHHRVDVSSVESLVGPRTGGIVAIAGTTQVGSIDPIAKVAKVARTHGVPLHVDAAFGGYVLPFLPSAQEFGFRIPGVETVAMDTHKMAMGTIGAGAVLFRTPHELDELAVETPYLTTPRQRGILGTRSAGPVAGAVAAWEALGPEGYHRVVRTCLENTQRLCRAMSRAGWQPLVEPELNILALPHPHPEALQAALAERGWRVNVLSRLKAIRLVVMPHVDRETIDELVPDLLAARQATQEVKGSVIHATAR